MENESSSDKQTTPNSGKTSTNDVLADDIQNLKIDGSMSEPSPEKPKPEISENNVSSATEKKTDNGPKWRFVGRYAFLCKVKCRRIHAKMGSRRDLALFFEKGKFYALSAWCSHMGGPLFKGEIEDYKGSCHVMCPWHAYMFDLASGRNEIGLQQETFPVRVDGQLVYIQHVSELSLDPYL